MNRLLVALMTAIARLSVLLPALPNDQTSAHPLRQTWQIIEDPDAA